MIEFPENFKKIGKILSKIADLITVCYNFLYEKFN